MVKVRQEQPAYFDGSINLELWLCQLDERVPGLNLARLRGVCDLSQQAEEKAIAADHPWQVGQSSFKTGLDMADILTELRLDEPSLIAAIIYRAVRENQITLNHVRKKFGDQVADIVQGVLRMVAISNIQLASNQPILGTKSDQLEQARRMLISLADDVRVVLIKLAERTCAIRQADKRSRKDQIHIAREILEIYSPLAHRLGIGYLKWELEDLAFRYLKPESYKRIAGLLDGKRTDRQAYIERVKKTLDSQLQAINIEAKLNGRAKHIYSIWWKMQNKGIAFSEVYDVRAVRILVNEESDCYRVLGVVHRQWRNVPREFDDYIASPKENGYRSLHTAVFGPEGKVLEIQIRTYEMHQESEFGVYSHWAYKTPDKQEEPIAYQERIAWLRQILDWQDGFGDLSDIAKMLRDEVSLDRIYVSTPEGHVIDMIPGATSVDFAYRIHTEVGHKCQGAKINNRVVSLNTPLRSGDHVEILVGEEQAPRREWLHQHLGYVATSRAKVKIQSWFRQRTKHKKANEGKKQLLNELRHLGYQHIDPKILLPVVGYTRINDLYTAIGSGDINSLDVIVTALDLLESRSAFSAFSHRSQLNLVFDQYQTVAIVTGIGDLAHKISKCCKPVLGDSIVGVLSDVNVVHIHRQDCIEALRADHYGRLMRLDWQQNARHTFPIEIHIEAFDRSGLLYDITDVLVKQQTNVIAMNSVLDKHLNRVDISMEVGVASLNELLRILEKIEQLSNVIRTQRTMTY